MVNEEKVRIMTNLAMYEQGEGKKHLPISRFYRSDYLGNALIKNFFLVTIGYFLILASTAAYFGEYLMENIHKMNLISTAAYIIIGYAVVVVLYTLITYIRFSVKYYQAKKSVKEYFAELNKLNKMYECEEKKVSGRTGGYRK